LKTTTRKRSDLLLLPFGVVFTILGIWFGGVVIQQLVLWSTTQSWIAIEATPLSAEEKTGYDLDGDPYRQITARYRYSIDGRDYESDQLVIGVGPSGLDNTKALVFDDIARALESGTKITVFVDPSNPANAVCSRNLQIGYLVGAAIATLAFGLPGILCLRRARRNVRFGAINNTNASREVEIERDWSNPELAPNVDRHASSLWVPTFICALFAAFLLAGTVARRSGSPNLAPNLPLNLTNNLTISVESGLAATFSLGTAVFGAFALRKTLRLRQLRGTMLRLDPHPGSIGGSLGGTLTLPQTIGAVRSAKIELRCEQHETTGTERNRQTVVRVLWKETLRPEVADGVAPIEFHALVPDALPESTPLRRNPSIEWRIDATVVTERGTHAIAWCIPVFAGARTSSIEPTAFVPPTPSDAVPGDFGSPWGAGIERPLTAGFELDFPPARSKLIEIGGTMFAVLIGTIFWFFPTVFSNGAQDAAFDVILFRSFGVGIPLFVVILTWSVTQNRLQVVVDRDGIRTRWSLLGFTLRQIGVPRDAIKGVAPANYSAVVVRRKDNTEHIIVRGLEGDSAARFAASVFARRTSLPLLEETVSDTR